MKAVAIQEPILTPNDTTHDGYPVYVYTGSYTEIGNEIYSTGTQFTGIVYQQVTSAGQTYWEYTEPRILIDTNFGVVRESYLSSCPTLRGVVTAFATWEPTNGYTAYPIGTGYTLHPDKFTKIVPEPGEWPAGDYKCDVSDDKWTVLDGVATANGRFIGGYTYTASGSPVQINEAYSSGYPVRVFTGYTSVGQEIYEIGASYTGVRYEQISVAGKVYWSFKSPVLMIDTNRGSVRLTDFQNYTAVL